jgi:hypothetical protein
MCDTIYGIYFYLFVTRPTSGRIFCLFSTILVYHLVGLIRLSVLVYTSFLLCRTRLQVGLKR